MKSERPTTRAWRLAQLEETSEERDARYRREYKEAHARPPVKGEHRIARIIKSPEWEGSPGGDVEVGDLVSIIEDHGPNKAGCVQFEVRNMNKSKFQGLFVCHAREIEILSLAEALAAESV